MPWPWAPLTARILLRRAHGRRAPPSSPTPRGWTAPAAGTPPGLTLRHRCGGTRRRDRPPAARASPPPPRPVGGGGGRARLTRAEGPHAHAALAGSHRFLPTDPDLAPADPSRGDAAGHVTERHSHPARDSHAGGPRRPRPRPGAPQGGRGARAGGWRRLARSLTPRGALAHSQAPGTSAPRQVPATAKSAQACSHARTPHARRHGPGSPLVIKGDCLVTDNS